MAPSWVSPGAWRSWGWTLGGWPQGHAVLTRWCPVWTPRLVSDGWSGACRRWWHWGGCRAGTQGHRQHPGGERRNRWQQMRSYDRRRCSGCDQSLPHDPNAQGPHWPDHCCSSRLGQGACGWQPAREWRLGCCAWGGKSRRLLLRGRGWGSACAPPGAHQSDQLRRPPSAAHPCGADRGRRRGRVRRRRSRKNGALARW